MTEVTMEMIDAGVVAFNSRDDGGYLNDRMRLAYIAMRDRDPEFVRLRDGVTDAVEIMRAILDTSEQTATEASEKKWWLRAFVEKYSKGGDAT